MTETPTKTELPEFITVGRKVEWQTWTREWATATITYVDMIGDTPIRVSTDTAGIWWEATCYRTLVASLPRTLRPAEEV